MASARPPAAQTTTATSSHICSHSLRHATARDVGCQLKKMSRQPHGKGYRTDITEEQLRGVPAFSRDRDFDGSDWSPIGSRPAVTPRLRRNRKPGDYVRIAYAR